MSTMTKVFIVLTAVLSIAVSCLFIAAAAQMANWRQLAEDYQELQQAEFTQRMNLQFIMEESLAMKEDALQGTQQSLAALQRQYQDAVSQLAEAKAELARQKNEAVAAEAGRKKLEEILDVQTAELTACQKQSQSLLTQNMDLQTRNTRLNSRVLELTSQNTILTDQVRNQREKLYACEQRVAALQEGRGSAARATRAEPVGAAAPVAAPVVGPIRGEVSEVDGAYASINIGEASGVVSGMTFMVHRGGDFVAELVIDRVRPEEAAGKLRTVQEQVRPGDSVAYGLGAAGN